MPLLLQRILAVPVSVGAFYLVASQPAWGFLQFVGFAMLAWSCMIIIGGFGAFFAVTGLIALMGCRSDASNGFILFVLPVYAVLSSGAVLACVVSRNPSLGKRIESGPFGSSGY